MSPTSTPRRVLVTGGAGFIGSTIVQSLAKHGHSVVVVDDLSTGVPANLVGYEDSLRIADISDATAFHDALRDDPFDVVVHCAARTKVMESMTNVELYRRVIVEGTINTVRYAERVDARMLVNISTGGAMYGETPTCATEHTPPAPTSNYGRFKLEAEGVVASASVPAITLRLANVYGPRQRQDLEGGVVAIFLRCWREREPLTVYGDGSAERDYIFVGDVADAVLTSLSGRWRGIYNVGTGRATSVNDLIVLMSDLLGPPPSIRFAAPRSVEIGRACLSPAKAGVDGLWWPATSLRDGLEATIAAT